MIESMEIDGGWQMAVGTHVCTHFHKEIKKGLWSLVMDWRHTSPM